MTHHLYSPVIIRRKILRPYGASEIAPASQQKISGSAIKFSIYSKNVLPTEADKCGFSTCTPEILPISAPCRFGSANVCVFATPHKAHQKKFCAFCKATDYQTLNYARFRRIVCVRSGPVEIIVIGTPNCCSRKFTY